MDYKIKHLQLPERIAKGPSGSKNVLSSRMKIEGAAQLIRNQLQQTLGRFVPNEISDITVEIGEKNGADITNVEITNLPTRINKEHIHMVLDFLKIKTREEDIVAMSPETNQPGID